MGPPLLPDPESRHIAPVTAHDAVHSTAAHTELTNTNAPTQHTTSNSDDRGDVGNVLPEDATPHIGPQLLVNDTMESSNGPMTNGLRYRAHGSAPPEATSMNSHYPIPFATSMGRGVGDATSIMHAEEEAAAEEGPYVRDNSLSLGVTPTPQAVGRDSFGNVHYERLIGNQNSSATNGGSHLGRWLQPGSSVSWSAAMAAVTAERWNVHKNHSSSNKSVRRYFKFLFAPLFWFLLQYAARVTFIAMLVPAAIIHANVTPRPFISDTFVLSGVIVGAGVHFGQSASFCVQFIKAGFIWLPIVLICIAIRLDRHHVAWFVVYTVVLFLMATFTDRTTRRMCLMLFNITLVALLSGNTSLLYPVRVLADWAIGAGFALVATLLPYPLLATRLSESVTRKMCTTTATCFQGILLCLWAPSNTERTMSMVRMRSYIWQLDQLVDRFDAYDVYTFYEVLLFDTSERREVRKEKVKLLLNLKMNLRSMVRVINILQERPQMLDQSNRCLLCRNHLSEPLDKVTQSIRELCDALGKAKTYADLHRALPCFEATGHAVKVLQDEFNMAQRVLFYESCDAPVTTTNGSGGAAFMPPDRMEEFIPLLTFLVFSVVNFWTSLREFQHFIVNHDSRHSARNTMLLIWRAMIEPFVDNARLVQLLCTRRGKPEMRVVIEAAKVSLAMFVSVLFFYFVNDRALLLSGPTTIAFISGTNPVEAVQASAARLSGTLVGSVLGYFAASLCNSGVDRVLAICIITFFLTLPRPAHSFGVVCSYCNFIIISNLGRTRQTSVDALSRIQQNTFAVLIYCFISITVYPLSPSRVLTQKRAAVLQGVNFAVRRLVSLMYEAADGYAALPPRNADETEEHNFNTTTTNNAGIHVVPNSAACGSSLSSQDTAQAKPAAGLLLLPKQPITSTCTNTPMTLTTNTNTTPCSQPVLPPAAVVVTMNGVPTSAAILSPQQTQQSRTTQHHRRRPRTRLIPVHTSRPPRAQTDAEEEMQMAFQGLTGGADEPLYRFPGIRTGLAHATTLTTMRPCAQNSLLVRRNVTSSAMATRRNTNDTTNTTSGDINRSIHSTLTINNNNSSTTSINGRNEHAGQNASSSHLPNSAPMSARNSTLIPFTFTVPEEEDRAIEEIMTVLASMLNWMKETTHVMPLASDELHIIPRTYPTRSCMDVHAALYRLCALVYTMACSWKQMRSKGYFTEEVGHILANLAPIAGDITACLDHFMQLFVVYVRDPSAELGNELTWRVMQLRALCAELSLRKERDILATIRQTVREQGFFGKGGNNRNSAHNSPLRYNNTTTIPRPTVVEQPALSSNSVQWSARGVTQAASSAGAGRGRDMNASSGSEPGSFLSLVPFTTSATMGPAAPHDLSTTRPGMQVDGSRSDSRAQPMRRSTQMPHSTNNEEAGGGSNVRVEMGHSDPLTRQPSDVRTIYYNTITNTARDEGMDEPNTTQRSQSRLVSNGTRIFSDRTGLANTANALVNTEPIAEAVNTNTSAMQPVAQTVFSTPPYVPLMEQSRSPSALTRHSAAAPPAELEFDASVLTHAEQLRAELRRHRRHRTQSMMSGLTTNTTTTTTLRNAGLGGIHSSTASVVTTSTPQNEYGGPGRSPFAPPSLSPQGSLSPETPALTYSQASLTLCNLDANGTNTAPGATLANNNTNNNTTGQPVLDSAGEAHVDPLRAPGTNSSIAPAPFAANDEVEDNYGNRSLIRFADSFTIPVTVLDTEGLHAFTLSLEMLGKELRRVLYGMEEMLQSKLMEL